MYVCMLCMYSIYIAGLDFSVVSCVGSIHCMTYLVRKKLIHLTLAVCLVCFLCSWNHLPLHEGGMVGRLVGLSILEATW